jgi:sec-independent protein translocase protein TatB
MFGIGMTELLVVLVVALLVLGPRRLPEIARSLGRGMAEFRRASSDLRATLTASLEEETRPPNSQARAASPSGAVDGTRSGQPPEEPGGAPASGGPGPAARSEP